MAVTLIGVRHDTGRHKRRHRRAQEPIFDARLVAQPPLRSQKSPDNGCWPFFPPEVIRSRVTPGQAVPVLGGH